MEWAVELATKVLRQKSTVVYLTDDAVAVAGKMKST